jgi:hypothetical protein
MPAEGRQAESFVKTGNPVDLDEGNFHSLRDGPNDLLGQVPLLLLDILQDLYEVTLLVAIGLKYPQKCFRLHSLFRH